MEIIMESLPHFYEALILTLKLGMAGIIFSILFGFLMAISIYFKIPVINKINQAYIEFARNTPLLIQLFFLYYGLPKIGITWHKEVVAIIGLTFLGTAYMAESFRSSFDGVPKSQIESAKALGFNRWQLTKEVVFPQGLPLSISSVGANVIFLLKETSVFSGIAVMDLTNTARDLISLYYRTYEYLFALVVFYLIMILPFTLLLSWLERRVLNVGR